MMHLNTVAAEGMTRLLRSLYLQCGDGEEAEQRPPRDLRGGIATPCGRGYRYDCRMLLTVVVARLE